MNVGRDVDVDGAPSDEPTRERPLGVGVQAPSRVTVEPLLTGVSDRLRSFVAEQPFERTSILEFVRRAALRVAPGSRVLDLGAGDAPYRELFSHADYVTVDHADSLHEGLAHVDIVASADALPFLDEAFDAALLTQVLEHLPDPARVLAELKRVLCKGRRLFLTVPLVWELHELPHDYFRYTAAGLERLLVNTGFEIEELSPRTDCFSTLAQLMRNIGAIMGSRDDDLEADRRAVADALFELADVVASFHALDVKGVLPLGYSAMCRRPT